MESYWWAGKQKPDQRASRLQQKPAFARYLPEHSILQNHRVKAVPPLPRAFANLEQGAPHFREAAAEPRSQPFPELSGLRPLVLSAEASSVNPDSVAPLSGSGGGGTGSIGSSAACSAASCSSAPVPANSSASTRSQVRETCRGLRVGVVFAGENRSLPHNPVNVVTGLFSYLSAAAPGSRIVGFQDGPLGLLARRCRELTAEEVWANLNQGLGLHYGTCSQGGLSPAERVDDAKQAAEVCAAEKLDSLVIVAGPRDLSWSAALAINFAKMDCTTTVVAVPHSKNLNLYVPHFMPVTLGFDSARRMLSEVVGNIMVDSLSSKKYWHFIRCGADAQTLEVALQTRCTFSVLSMEWRAKEGTPDSDVPEERMERMTLQAAVNRLREVIERRRTLGRPSGVVLVSEGIIKTLPEMDELKQELLELFGEHVSSSKPPFVGEVEKQLKSERTRELFKRLPRFVQMSLILKRDSMGMPLLPSDLEGERLLGRFVQQALQAAKDKAPHSIFAPRFHVVDLMSNAPLPSPFDCAFGYSLGHTAGALVCERRLFYVASCARMHLPVEEWEPCAVPFSYLYPPAADMQTSCSSPVKKEMAAEIPTRCSIMRDKLEEVYRFFRKQWVECNVIKSPGPMQFDGCGDVGPLCERPFSLLAEVLSVDELKQMIQPCMVLPPPLRISDEPLVYRDIRILENLSTLERKRLSYVPALPQYLRSPVRAQVEDITPLACNSNKELTQAFPLTHSSHSAVSIVPFAEDSTAPAVLQLPPKHQQSMRVGVVFSSNQVPGFHTVVAGLFDYLASIPARVEVVGFLCGFEGLIANNSVVVSKDMVDQYRNLGGQDMLCQFGDPASLAFKEQLKAVVNTVAKQQLDGLVLVGNLESQLDSAFIAEACAAEHLTTRVIGVPVSFDCDFPFVQQTVGYDTLCRTLSAYIGNVGSMAETHGDRWIFVRIMGDAWSHVAVECSLQTHPNLVLLSGSKLHGQCLAKIVECVCDVIIARHEAGSDYGVVLIPVGFVMDITELRHLFAEIMEIMASGSYESGWDSIPKIAAKLKPQMAALFDAIPRDVQYEICFGGRERHTNKIDLSVISTDRLMMRFVEIELQRRRLLGAFAGEFFRGACCPMVFQARSANPTNFDCDLAYTLGWGAGALVALGKTALLVHATCLELGVDEWKLGGFPLSCLLLAKYDEATRKERIMPAKVNLLKQRGIIRPLYWLPVPEVRHTVYHGPVQFYGDTATDPTMRITWYMENMPIQDPTDPLREISRLCSELQSTMAQARAESTLYAVNSLLKNALSVLESYRNLLESSRTTACSLADVPIEQKP